MTEKYHRGMTMDTELLQRELRVAFSPHAQPVWFRITKYLLLFFLVRRYYGSRRFWPVLGTAFCCAMALHFFYRHKTHGWTEPWGIWDDVQATKRQ